MPNTSSITNWPQFGLSAGWRKYVHELTGLLPLDVLLMLLCLGYARLGAA